MKRGEDVVEKVLCIRAQAAEPALRRFRKIDALPGVVTPKAIVDKPSWEKTRKTVTKVVGIGVCGSGSVSGGLPSHATGARSALRDRASVPRVLDAASPSGQPGSGMRGHSMRSAPALACTSCGRRDRGRDPRGEAGGGRRHLVKKALVVKVRGRAILRMQRVASADSLLTVPRAWLGGERPAPPAQARSPRRVGRGDGEAVLPRCGLRRSSSAGSWVRIRASVAKPRVHLSETNLNAGSSSAPGTTRRWSDPWSEEETPPQPVVC